MRKNHKEYIIVLFGMLILFAISIIAKGFINREKEKIRKESIDSPEYQRIYGHWMDFSEERDLPYTDAEGY